MASQHTRQGTMKLDRETQLMITQVVNDAVKRALEGAEERWLTRKQLLEQFGMLSEDWVKKHGKHLCPASAIVIEDGVEHVTREAYPLHKINRMIQENRLVFDEDDCRFRPSRGARKGKRDRIAQ